MKVTGELIWQVTRGLQETGMLLQHMGQHFLDAGKRVDAEKFFAKARDLSVKSSRYQQESLDHEALSSEKLEQEDPIDSPQESGTAD